jgi:hypothetical protein
LESNIVSNQESERGSHVSTEISETEARLALGSIERRRQQVIAEIDLPPWYWSSVAAGWVGLGVLTEYGPAWATIAGTVAFGAVHSAIAPRVLSGRHGSPHLSVRRDMVSRHVPALVFGFLIVMTMATVALAQIANADGARSPAILASVVVGALVLTGGPNLMTAVRRRAERRLNAV